MKEAEKIDPKAPGDMGFLQKGLDRRRFMRYAGTAMAATSLLAIAGCADNGDDPGADGLSFGTGDVAILNYAYALEQLEAAFYTQLIATPYVPTAILEELTGAADYYQRHGRCVFDDIIRQER